MTVQEIAEADDIHGQDLAISNASSPVEKQQNVADPDPDDPEAPSVEVSAKRQRMSDLFTIFCAGELILVHTHLTTVENL